MKKHATEMAGLSDTEIEQRLQRPGLPDEEREALVEELSNRVTEELLAGRGAPSPKDPAAGAHSFQPPPVSTPPPQPRPAAPQTSTWQPDGPAPVGTAAPRPSPAPPDATPHWPGRGTGAQLAGARRAADDESAGAPRKGFARSLASLLALLLVAGGAWLVITLVNASNNGGGTATGGGSGGDPRQVDDTASGPAGTARVDWVLEGVPIVARLETNGSSGVAEVTYVNPETGAKITVREDLELERTGGVWHYTGSNPRDANTGASLSESEYSPDVFYLKKSGNGWYFTEVCDRFEGTRCAPAHTTVP